MLYYSFISPFSFISCTSCWPSMVLSSFIFSLLDMDVPGLHLKRGWLSKKNMLIFLSHQLLNPSDEVIISRYFVPYIAVYSSSSVKGHKIENYNVIWDLEGYFGHTSFYHVFWGPNIGQNIFSKCYPFLTQIQFMEFFYNCWGYQIFWYSIFWRKKLVWKWHLWQATLSFILYIFCRVQHDTRIKIFFQ